jgi:hypothetical protein
VEQIPVDQPIVREVFELQLMNMGQNRAVIEEVIPRMPRFELDPTSIAHELVGRLRQHDICPGFFADQRLGISKAYGISSIIYGII